jgi:hypothetical protein
VTFVIEFRDKDNEYANLSTIARGNKYDDALRQFIEEWKGEPS